MPASLPTHVYFRNAAGAVGAEPQAYVHLSWTGAPMSSGELRALYEQALSVLKQQRLNRILTDHRNMPPIAPIDQQWLSEEWVPRAVSESGYAHCAVVQSQNVFNRLGTAQVVMQLQTPLEVKYFDTAEEAAAWLHKRG
ncbi:STAS/SEC14 domain-containing protein [Hymenobacter sp. B81]|uniref:STAS/SEC14 domain-containing protein n=1 Tax=Hymenobacter sp. B81 TaxID=3344878 RepID=UPI0037DC46B9